MAAALLPYVPVWRAPYVYDDYPYLVENSDLNGGISRIPDLFLSSFPARAPERGLYRPVTAASFLIDRALGTDPRFSHAINVLLAGVLALSVFGLLERCVSSPGAFAGALLFAVHPVHVEAVAWVSGRAELLAAVFATCSLILARDAWTKGSRGRALASSVSFFLGVLSKENAAIAMALLPAYALVRRPSPGGGRGVFLLAGWAAAAGIALALRHAALSAFTPSASESVGPRGFLERIPLMIAATGEHLRLLVWPHPLSIERMPMPARELGEGSVLFGAALLACWTAMLFVLRRRKDLFPLAMWPPLALLPVSHLVPIGETVAERFLLFPSIGLTGLAGELLSRANASTEERKDPRVSLRSFSVPRLTVLCALLLFGLAATVSRASVWRSEGALWREAARHEPRSASVWAGLGDAERRAKAFERAAAHYLRALAIDPGLTPARLALASCLESQDLFEEALRETEKAVELDSQDAYALNNLGARLARAGRGEEARELYRRAVRSSPRYALALRNLGLAALEAGDLEEARSALRRARKADPTLPDLELLEARAAAGP